jgi:ferredoxin-type protein NapF
MVSPLQMAMISRAQFLRGEWRGNNPSPQPPWALANGYFAAVCDGCGDCVEACPQHILKLSGRGLAEVDFTQGECTFCADCVAACPTGALSRDGIAPPWSLTARVSGRCLAMNGTSCIRCIESCASEAIVSRPALRGRVMLSIVDADCTGCGACFATCPVKAISIQAAQPNGGSNQEINRRIQ